MSLDSEKAGQNLGFNKRKTHPVDDVEPLRHSEDEEDVVFGQFLPEQSQGRIILHRQRCEGQQISAQRTDKTV